MSLEKYRAENCNVEKLAGRSEIALELEGNDEAAFEEDTVKRSRDFGTRIRSDFSWSLFASLG